MIRRTMEQIYFPLINASNKEDAVALFNETLDYFINYLNSKLGKDEIEYLLKSNIYWVAYYETKVNGVRLNELITLYDIPDNIIKTGGR